ncbi:MAG: UDP-N-acetylglucosamine 2-epimerase, partial [Planctomycetes bacterium]|nr:UDP-N-acetylglucosamine 2-epimerase [Planctomycetota bacterium]
DTTSAFASALGAFYAGAKIAHVGGGLRTGDMANPFPEEGHRTMATRLASLHLAATARARAALKAEGIHPGKVEVTGSPIVDTLRKALALEAPIEADLASWIEGRKLAVLTVRRSDRLGEGAAGVVEAIRVLHDRDAALRWALVLRRDHAPSDILRAQLQGLERVRFLDRMPYPVFLTLLKRASILLTDAGGILEEAPSLGIPVVLLADKTSRVEALEGGWAELAGTDPKRIQQAFDAYRRRWLAPRAPSPYGDGHAAARIVAALRRKIGLR